MKSTLFIITVAVIKQARNGMFLHTVGSLPCFKPSLNPSFLSKSLIYTYYNNYVFVFIFTDYIYCCSSLKCAEGRMNIPLYSIQFWIINCNGLTFTGKDRDNFVLKIISSCFKITAILKFSCIKVTFFLITFYSFSEHISRENVSK